MGVRGHGPGMGRAPQSHCAQPRLGDVRPPEDSGHFWLPAAVLSEVAAAPALCCAVPCRVRPEHAEQPCLRSLFQCVF